MGKYQPSKMIKHSRFKNYYSTLSERNQVYVRNEIARLIGENEEYNDKRNYGYLCNLYVALAMVYMHEGLGKTRQEAIAEVKAAMFRYLQPAIKQMANLSKLSIFVPFLRLTMPLKFRMTLGYGWDVEFPKVPKGSFAMTTHRCIYTDLYKKYGIPELTAIFCSVDDLLYGNLPGAEFNFTQRLGTGGTMCDYCFKKKIINRQNIK